MYKLFDMRDENDNYVNEWTLQVKAMFSSLGFGYLWNVDTISKLQIEKVVERIYDQFLQGWYSDLSNSSKLET